MLSYYWYIIVLVMILKINRLLETTIILLNRGTVTAKELAERFEVSTRTIYRDVEVGQFLLPRCKSSQHVKKSIRSDADFLSNELVIYIKQNTELTILGYFAAFSFNKYISFSFSISL